jgi:hypothetical protein
VSADSVLASARKLMISEPVSHNLAPSFENTIKLWLDQTATKTKQWADAALGVDTVRPLEGSGLMIV